MVRASLWVPCWTNLRLIKVILVASTLTYLPSPEVASTLTYLPSPKVASSKLYNLYQAIRPARFTSSGIRASALDTGSILSYYFFFVICPGLCFVLVLLFVFLFVSCCVLVYLFFVLVLVLVTFFVIVLVSCVFHTLCKKKKLQKFEKTKKVGVWSLNTKLRHLEVFFGNKIVDQIPLSTFSSEFWAFWYIVGLKQIIIAKVMSIWSSLVISIILSVYLICYHICYPN